MASSQAIASLSKTNNSNDFSTSLPNGQAEPKSSSPTQSPSFKINNTNNNIINVNNNNVSSNGVSAATDGRRVFFKAKRPSKRLLEAQAPRSGSFSLTIGGRSSTSAAANGLYSAASAATAAAAARRNAYMASGRPGSVDIDSFYEDDTCEDLMTRFNADVRRQTKNNHKSRSRFGRGLAKKNGAGGHFTWGAAGSELESSVTIDPIVDNTDPLDPNYDSDSEENCKFETITPPLDDDEVERYLTPILQEYFEHGDSGEVESILADVNLAGNYYQILTTIVTLAMERKSSTRELASMLVSDLYDRLLCAEDFEQGFNLLLDQLDDLVLDTPDASAVLGKFIARAVADDCLPPRYVTATKEKLEHKQHQKAELSRSEALALKAIELAYTLIHAKRGLIALDTVWGLTGGAKPVKYLIKQMRLLLKEYLSSRDVDEAGRCLRELEVPHFFHEFVYEAILMGIEDLKRADDLVAISKLLKSLTDTNLISVDQLKKGFMRLFGELPDIQIDVPHAYATLEKFMQSCFSEKLFLPRGIVDQVPSRGRKRFISENNDGGRIKE